MSSQLKSRRNSTNCLTISQVELQAFIEEAIARGELVRSEVNQTVLTPEGGFIGANMKEALAYFSNPENADYKKALETKLKL